MAASIKRFLLALILNNQKVRTPRSGLMHVDGPNPNLHTSHQNNWEAEHEMHTSRDEVANQGALCSFLIRPHDPQQSQVFVLVVTLLPVSSVQIVLYSRFSLFCLKLKLFPEEGVFCCSAD